MEPQQSKSGFGLVVAENADPAESARYACLLLQLSLFVCVSTLSRQAHHVVRLTRPSFLNATSSTLPAPFSDGNGNKTSKYPLNTLA